MFNDLELSAKQTYGALAAIACVLFIQGHFVWVAWTDPDSFPDADRIYEADRLKEERDQLKKPVGEQGVPETKKMK